jgi:signal transduction histidine kinase
MQAMQVMDQAAYDLQRAEWLRRRYRLITAVLAVSVVGLGALTFNQFGSPARALMILSPVLLSMLAQYWWLRQPRAWRVLETYVVVGGFSIIIGSCVTLYFVRLEDLPRYALTMLLSMLTIPSLCRLAARWTLAHILTYVAGITLVVILRGPVPLLGPLALVQVIGAAAALALDAASRDQFARSEFAALEAARTAHAHLLREEEVLRRLFVNLSHDFRTPLAVISAHAHELATREPGPIADSAGRITGQAQLLADLVEQLLELARLDAGRTPVTPSVVSLERIAREVAVSLQPQGAEIEVRADARIGASADERHVRRILQNLVANAVRQLERGATRVEVRLSHEGAHACVEIHDDGVGIGPDRRASIFERFASFDSDGSTASGIGLPLARELARLNGGELTLVDAQDGSVAGRGATFRLTLPGIDLPATAAVNAATGQAAGPPPTRAEPSLERSDGEVLLVEDNAAMAEVIRAALEPRWSITHVASLGAAAALLDTHLPQAIVSDVLLGDGTAYQLLERLRRDPRLREVPLIILSALGEEQERVRGLLAGADDYLAKPFSVDELRARLAGALERVARRRAAVRRLCDEFIMELHDGVTGALSRAAVLLAASLRERGDARIERAGTAVAEALDEARTLMAVVDGACEGFDLFVSELRGEVAGLCERHELELRFETTGVAGTSLLPTTAQALRRIALELLTNTVKHARARCVTIDVGEAEGFIRLRMTDDGVGLPPEHLDGRGLGQIRRRVARLGGAVRFDPVPRGVALEVRLPNVIPS